MDKDKLYNQLIENVKKDDYDKNFIILFLGNIGSGKSTYSKRLSDDLQLYVAKNEEIRELVNGNRIDNNKNIELVHELSNYRINYLLKNNISFIYDADATRRLSDIIDLAGKYSYELFLIWLDCPDDILMQRRLKRDVKDGVDPTESIRIINENNESYKKLRESIDINDKVDIKIDTTKDFEKNISIIEETFNSMFNQKNLK